MFLFLALSLGERNGRGQGLGGADRPRRKNQFPQEVLAGKEHKESFRNTLKLVSKCLKMKFELRLIIICCKVWASCSSFLCLEFRLPPCQHSQETAPRYPSWLLMAYRAAGPMCCLPSLLVYSSVKDKLWDPADGSSGYWEIFTSLQANRGQ